MQVQIFADFSCDRMKEKRNVICLVVVILREECQALCSSNLLYSGLHFLFSYYSFGYVRLLLLIRIVLRCDTKKLH